MLEVSLTVVSVDKQRLLIDTFAVIFQLTRHFN